MKVYRKKPVEVEAVLFEGVESATAIIDWILAGGGTGRYHETPVADPKCPTPEYHETHRYCPSCPWADDAEHIAIDTLEGTMRAEVGDYVICGVRGEFYPCKPDIFAATYDEVER